MVFMPLLELSCMVYLLPHVSEPLSRMRVQFWWLVQLNLDKFVMNFHYFGKIQGFHINSLFTLHFFLFVYYESEIFCDI